MNNSDLSKRLLFRRYYCYSLNPDQEVRSGVSSTIMINNGLNILERVSIPTMVQYLCTTLVAEEENGALYLIKKIMNKTQI